MADHLAETRSDSPRPGWYSIKLIGWHFVLVSVEQVGFDEQRADDTEARRKHCAICHLVKPAIYVTLKRQASR